VSTVVALFDDLLLGSNVLGMLRAAGHEARLTGDAALRRPLANFGTCGNHTHDLVTALKVPD